jgi:hypothetical protein
MKTFDIVKNAVQYFLLRGLICGAGLGAIYGTLIIPIIGTAYGVIFGAVAGVLLGAVLGIVVGLVSARFFNPVRDVRIFRIVVLILSGLITFSGGLFGAVLLYGFSNPKEPLIPALIATGSAMYVGSRYTRRYLAGKRVSS